MSARLEPAASIAGGRTPDAHEVQSDAQATVVAHVAEQVRATDASLWNGWALVERRALVEALVGRAAPLLAEGVRDGLADAVLARVSGLGPLEALLADPEISEVMVNGGGEVWIERQGRLEPVALRLDEELVLLLIERIVSPLGLRVDRSSPLVDARLADGSRINAIVRPIAVDGPCLTIRRFGARRIPLDDFTTAGVAAVLRWAVAARMNLLVSGGTGSGKTTLLNAIAGAIPPTERVVTIEDTAELVLATRHVVRLEARPANAEGLGGLGIRDLMRNALRMRPDRIVVGEVRGAEALDMLQAMNTGHEGSLSTCHANSPTDALRRIETMILMGPDAVPAEAIRAQIESSVDLVVQVARTGDGARRITDLCEVGPAGCARSLLRAGSLASLPERPARRGTARPDPRWVL